VSPGGNKRVHMHAEDPRSRVYAYASLSSPFYSLPPNPLCAGDEIVEQYAWKSRC